jgi:dTMP kinase
MQGKFIVFEGIDKSGKATQARLLCEYLRSKGKRVVYTEEPTSDSPFGRMLKEWLAGKFEIESGEAITLLYAADRFEHLKRKILPALAEGKTVVSDRYFYSTIAYESALFGVKPEWIRQLHENARKPDLVIFIDIAPEISLRRKRKRPDDRLEKAELLTKVRNAYHSMAKDERFFVVDGDRPKEEISGEVKKIVARLLGL